MAELEGETDVFTRVEVYDALEAERKFLADENTGHVMRREAWERVDFFLDLLVDLNAIEATV